MRPGHLDRTRTRASSSEDNGGEGWQVLGADKLEEVELPVVESVDVGLSDATHLGILENLVDDLLRLANHDSQERVTHDGIEEEYHLQNSESQKDTGEETVRDKEHGRDANTSAVVGVRTAIPDEKKHDFYLHSSTKVGTINDRLVQIVEGLEQLDDLRHDGNLANGVKRMLDINFLLDAPHVAGQVPKG